MAMTEYNHLSATEEFAVIDLGSNSFHMVIARIVDGAIQMLGRVKQRVQLAAGLDRHHRLNDETMARALACLALFAERLQGFRATRVRMISTHALRQATNAHLFLQQAAGVIPYSIEVISGQEEARLIYMGVEHTHPSEGRKLVIDIGGGSTEIVIGENFQTELVESRKMGCINFGERFFAQGIIDARQLQRARLSAYQKWESMAWQYRICGWQHALGCSSTIKTICDVLQAMGERERIITRSGLDKLFKKVGEYATIDGITLPGLVKERRAMFVSGLAILAGIFDALALKVLHPADGALREGVLYEMEGRLRHQDICSRTANSLASHYAVDHSQADRVWSTTQHLYLQWQKQNISRHKPQLTALLHWAAKLHEVGLTINHSGMHRHSAYILSHSNMPGFNQDQQALLATLVRYHRKAIAEDDLPRFNLFKRKHYLPLILLLRLGILLNNQRQATTQPQSLDLITANKQWTLRFPTGFFSRNALVQLDLEREQTHWQGLDNWQLIISDG